jgi:hypothetical protein
LPIEPDRPLSLTLLPCGAVEAKELKDLARALTAKGMLVTIAKAWPTPPEVFKSRGQ